MPRDVLVCEQPDASALPVQRGWTATACTSALESHDHEPGADERGGRELRDELPAAKLLPQPVGSQSCEQVCRDEDDRVPNSGDRVDDRGVSETDRVEHEERSAPGHEAVDEVPEATARLRLAGF